MKVIFWSITLMLSTSCWAQFGPRQVIDQNSGSVRVLRTADFDNDNDLDIVVASSDFIGWYQNLDGLGTFSEPITIQLDMMQSFSLFPADIDSDGAIDLVVSFFDEDQVVWYRNLGNGIFSPLKLITSDLLGASGVTAADLDGDGDLDLVLGVSNGNGLYWVENLDGLGNFGSRITIDNMITQARTQSVGDIDGDGDLDILTNSASGLYVSWFENINGLGDFDNHHIIDIVGLYENSINLVDIDNDGDPDIVSQKNDLVIWRENIDGQGEYGGYEIITTEALNIFDTNAADLDNDGDVDVFSASTDDNKIAWYRNEDGSGDFGPQNIIDPALQSPRTVHAADIDGDGDLDVLSAALSNLGRELVWYENYTILGNPEFDTPDVRVYPNPVHEVLFLECKTAPINSVAVYDVLGRRLLLQTGTIQEIDLSGIPVGFLFIEIGTTEGVLVEKVIKE